MALKLKTSAREIAERMQGEMFLKLKALHHQLAPRKGRPLTVFLSGVGRSGTNMLLNILEASYETDVFHEGDRRAFNKFIMREPEVIHSLVERSNAPVVIVKGLHEADRIKALMTEFAPAKALWMVRFYGDFVNSHLQRWPGTRNMLEQTIADRNGVGWRTAGMTDETYRIVCDHYRPALTSASAHALFWYYRNQLFFNQGFDSNPNVLIVEYEELVRTRNYLDGVASFVGISPTDKMRRIAHGESVRKNPLPDIAPDVKALCEAMQARLKLAAKSIVSEQHLPAAVNA